MADAPIPADLIQAQREFNAAYKAVTEAAAKNEPIDALMDTERELALKLHRMREGTPWAAWAEQKRVREAAAGEE